MYEREGGPNGAQSILWAFGLSTMQRGNPVLRAFAGIKIAITGMQPERRRANPKRKRLTQLII